MMVFSPINDETYDTAANQIAYCKMFPLIVEDFLARLDCKEMMLSTNLSAQVDAGQGVVTTTPSGPGAGSTVSPGSGRVIPTYFGEYQKPGTITLGKQKKAIKESGGQVTESVLETAVGG